MKKLSARKPFYLSFALLLFLIGATILEFMFMYVETATIGGKLLFFFLLNLNLLAFVSLIYFVGVNMVRLVRERRRRILGHRFKTRMVAIFLVLISIPSTLMFIVATGLGTNYIDRFFTPQFKRPMESSLKIARSIYDMERQRTLEFAELAKNGHTLPPQYKVFFFDTPPDESTAAIQSAFEGTPYTEVISSARGDMIRAALPSGRTIKGTQGIVVVETVIPYGITRNTEMIMETYQDYVNLEKWKSPLKLNYFLILAFFTLIIIFAAIWLALKIAGWFAEPVRQLAEATEEVASGNLQVRVSTHTQDEMGMLVKSFNRMVQELYEGEESLQQAYRNLENIVKNIQSGVISLNANADIGAINEAACRILDVQAEEVISHHYTAILSKMESDELQNMISSINIHSLKEVTREVWVSIAGRKTLLKIFITGIKGASGEHIGLLVVLDDLTDIFRAQRAVAWQEVARRMAHEIKNPLTPIKLSTERMLKKWQTKDPEFEKIFERSTKTIVREVDGLRKMVDEFSRLGKMPELHKISTNVEKLLREVLELYRGFRNLSLELITNEEVIVAEIDPDQFKRVIINLIDNSLVAMGHKGNIIISLARNVVQNRLYIDVSDDGPGIPEEDKERLFQPYFSTRKDGTGLGLAIADKIISEHNGTIQVKDNVPKGSVFSIEIPISDAA